MAEDSLMLLFRELLPDFSASLSLAFDDLASDFYYFLLIVLLLVADELFRLDLAA